MKKSFILPLIITPLLLTGCPSSLTEKIQLDYGTYADSALRVINHAQLDEMVSNKLSFVLAVSPAKQTCVCWHDFKAILEDYVQNEHILVYEISYNSFFDNTGTQLSTHGIEIHENEETFTIFNDGKLAKQEIYNADNAMFKQKAKFKEYMELNTLKPHMYYVDLVNLSAIYDSKEYAVIYFGRSGCPDCQYVDSHFLRNYSFKDEQNIYIVDFELLGIYNTGSYQTTKDLYGLSAANNPNFGFTYGEEGHETKGVVPTFQLIKGNETSYASSIESACVYFNDTVTAENDTYYISESYYSEERAQVLQYLDGIQTKVLKGKTLTREEVSVVEYQGKTYTSFIKEKAAVYHDAFLNSFLEYAFKKSTFTL